MTKEGVASTCIRPDSDHPRRALVTPFKVPENPCLNGLIVPRIYNSGGAFGPKEEALVLRTATSRSPTNKLQMQWLYTHVNTMHLFMPPV